MGTVFGFDPVVFAIIIVWSLVWKGIALWKSGRNNQLAWFVVLLIVSTIGILEIIYIAFFQKPKPKTHVQTAVEQRAEKKSVKPAKKRK